MKKLFAILSFVLTFCLVFTSCKDDSKYPENIDGLWAGSNGSTGYTCNVQFTTSASSGQTCKISIVSPGQQNATEFLGRFTYDQNSGIAQFTSTDFGAPAATFRLNDNGTVLSGSIQSSAVNYGEYSLEKVSFPSNIVGAWGGTATSPDATLSIKAHFEAYAVMNGIPVSITISNGTPINGTYTYDSNTGAASVTVPGMATTPFQYNVNTNTLEGKIAEYNVIVERLAE